jgi:hypothetical protein
MLVEVMFVLQDVPPWYRIIAYRLKVVRLDTARKHRYSAMPMRLTWI